MMCIGSLGTTQEVSKWVNIFNNKGAISVAQLTNNEDGMPSGLAAVFGESSCMALIIISSDNTITVKYNSVDCSMDG